MMNFSDFLPKMLAPSMALCLLVSCVNLVGAETQEPPAYSAQEPQEARDSHPQAHELFDEARRLHEAGDTARALRIYRHITRRHSTSPVAPEAHFQAALIRLNRKQWAKAFDNYQAIVENYPDYLRFEQVIRGQYEIADALRQGARLRLFWRVPGLRSPERAIEYFEQVVENAPYSELAPEALIKAAQMQNRRRQLDEAIDLFDRFISEYLDHEHVPEAYFGLAEAFSTRVRGPEYDQGASREAIGYYEDFAILYPRHPKAAEAEYEVAQMQEILAQSRVVLGDFYLFRRNNFPAARVFYNEAITIAPLSMTAEEARQKLIEVERRAQAR